jgi:hypothetical protein
MADPNQSKAERRQAADQQTKADRKAAKLRRRQRTASADEPSAPAAASDASGDRIEKRLARLEQAVAAQSELSEQLLEKLDEMLLEARRSTEPATNAASPAVAEVQEDEEEGF